MLVGYVRALPDLAIAPQRAALERLACQKLYEEPDRASRHFAERDRMLDHLWDGDVVVVARLACLADTLSELIAIGQRLFDREAGLISRGEPWADTTRETSASILATFNGLAALGLEPGSERAPSPAGAAPPPSSRRHDAKVGRPAKITPRQWEEYGARLLSGELAVPTAAKLIGCGRATLYRHIASIRGAD